MKDWKGYFKGKKITVLGLGLLGRAVNDARFLAEQGAELIVTDIKSDDALRTSLDILKVHPNIQYRLGGHSLEDFRERDFILKAAGIPSDSPFIEEAHKNGIPVKMSASWFAELAHIPVVGITGTRGKSTTTHLIYEILKASGMHVLLGGNVRGVSTLALLPDVTPNSVAVMELDSWQCRGFGDDGLSPNVGVFTTFYQDHMNYYKNDMDAYLADKMQLFIHQKTEDTFVVTPQVVESLTKYKKDIRAHVVVADTKKFPKDWKMQIPGEHNVLNAIAAIEAARALGVDEDVIQSAVQAFEGVPGRLQFIKELNGIKIYNDNNSTTPDATIAGLRALGDTSRKNIVLIMGGDEKNLDMSKLLEEIPKWCSKVVLFKERGTNRIRDDVFALSTRGVQVFEEEGLERTVRQAFAVSEEGETLLYSPAFSSFGKYFANEFDRGDQFSALVANL